MDPISAPAVLCGFGMGAVIGVIVATMSAQPKHSVAQTPGPTYSDGLEAGRQEARQAAATNEEEERNARLNYPVPDWLEVGRGVFNLAFTGPSGSGKSSLINALRRVTRRDPTAAPTGVKETTEEPKRYARFDLAGLQVNLWDLPGGGTKKFPADTYIQKYGLKYFDVVVIVTKDRPTEFDHSLVQEMERLTPPQPYKFVRTMVDFAIRNEAATSNCREEEVMDGVLSEIKEDLATQFPGMQEQTFLLSAFPGDQKRYDFPRFERDLYRTMCQVRGISPTLTDMAMRCMLTNNDHGFLGFGRALEQAEQLPPGQCPLCMDALCSYALDPCGHMAACERCVEPLQNCPWCRRDIEKKLRVYAP